MKSTETQLALLIQKVEHIAVGVDELKPFASLVMNLQNEQAHMADSLKQLSSIAEMRGLTQHQIDKRVLVLERWHRMMLALPVVLLTISLTAGGYAKSFIDSLSDFKDDTRQRVASLEFIINSPHYERSMMQDKEVPTGGRK